MIREEIERRIGDTPAWQNITELQRAEFVGQMAGRDYGREPLMDAFIWYTTGWEDGRTSMVRRHGPACDCVRCAKD